MSRCGLGREGLPVTSSRAQRIAGLEAEIEKLKDGIYHATLSQQLYAEWSLLLRDLEAELVRVRDLEERTG